MKEPSQETTIAVQEALESWQKAIGVESVETVEQARARVVTLLIDMQIELGATLDSVSLQLPSNPEFQFLIQSIREEVWNGLGARLSENSRVDMETRISDREKAIVFPDKCQIIKIFGLPMVAQNEAGMKASLTNWLSAEIKLERQLGGKLILTANRELNAEIPEQAQALIRSMRVTCPDLRIEFS